MTKCLLTVAAVALMLGPQAVAQSESSQGSSKNSALDLGLNKSTYTKALPKINLAAAEWKVRELHAALAKDPSNIECRLKLAQALESLAQYFEQRRDFLNAWRYYQGAAEVLNYPKEKIWKKRTDEDNRKAESCRKMRLDYLKGLKKEGFVFTTFNWKDYKKLDREAGMAYMKEVGRPISDNWSVAKKTFLFHVPEESSPAMIVSFKVHHDGILSDCKLTKSCGIPKIDETALQSVQHAGKVPPLLPTMGNVVPFEAQFVK